MGKKIIKALLTVAGFNLKILFLLLLVACVVCPWGALIYLVWSWLQ